MKENPITIGFDDATFELHSESKYTQLIGVICQGTRIINAVRDEILIDGDDATEKLIGLVKKNEKHVQYILTHSITFGGFNLINLETIYSKLQKPIIAITEKEVDFDSVKKALLEKFPHTYRNKIDCILSAGNLYETEIKTSGGLSKVWFHCKGFDINDVEKLLTKVCIDSKLPESLRLAHIIGRLFSQI
ncbi:MAG: DUF99 family protein [Candidatus Odinarchaeota archaeon]